MTQGFIGSWYTNTIYLPWTNILDFQKENKCSAYTVLFVPVKTAKYIVGAFRIQGSKLQVRTSPIVLGTSSLHAVIVNYKVI